MFYDTVMPIQLRPDLTVYISGIPWDLSPAEAKRLTTIIDAFAVDVDPRRSGLGERSEADELAAPSDGTVRR